MKWSVMRAISLVKDFCIGKRNVSSTAPSSHQSTTCTSSNRTRRRNSPHLQHVHHCVSGGTGLNSTEVVGQFISYPARCCWGGACNQTDSKLKAKKKGTTRFSTQVRLPTRTPDLFRNVFTNAMQW